MVVTGPGVPRWGFLLTSDEYRDFLLRFEFLVESGTKVNSGVTFWADQTDMVGDLPHPLQIEIFDRDRPGGLSNGTFFWSTSMRTADALSPDRPGILQPAGQWNVAELEVRAGLLRYAINGPDLLRADLNDLAKRPGAQPGLRRRSGRIGFQSHTGTIRFRNIEIKK
jgi:hypothetical protein